MKRRKKKLGDILPYLKRNAAKVIGFLLPIFFILVFGVDAKIFFAVYFFEIFAYMVFGIVRVGLFSRGPLHVMACAAALVPGILITTGVTASVIFAGENPAPLHFGLPALAFVAANQLKVFRLKTLKQLNFFKFVNANYVREGVPGEDVITKNSVIIGTVFKAYFFFVYKLVLVAIAFMFSSLFLGLFESALGGLVLIAILAITLLADYIEDDLDETEWAEENYDKRMEEIIRVAESHHKNFDKPRVVPRET